MPNCSLNKFLTSSLNLKKEIVVMDTILTMLPFNERRAPLVDKVRRDSELMYEHSRYVIVLNQQGCVVEERFNRRFDDDIVDSPHTLQLCWRSL